MTLTPLPPPSAFRLTRETEHVARHIGIRFDGKLRPNDVAAYNVDEGWIELNVRGRPRLRGLVEPFYREAPATLTPAPPVQQQTEEQADAARARAEAKRARRAAKMQAEQEKRS